MSYYVYLIQSVGTKKNKTYVGYTNNLTKRLFLHNNNKGAKSTRGFKWKISYKKKFVSKEEPKERICPMTISIRTIYIPKSKKSISKNN